MLQQLAGGIHDHHFHPGTQTRIQTHGALGAGGGGHQQAFQVTGKHLNGFLFTHFPHPAEQLGFQMGIELDLPGPAHHFLEPVIGGAAGVLPVGYGGDHGFAGVRLGILQLFRQHHGDMQDAFIAAPEQGQGAVAGDAFKGFAVVEIVAELGAVFFLAVDDFGLDVALVPEEGAQAGEQLGVFGEALHEDLFGTVQGVLGGGNLVFLVQVAGGQCFRLLGRIIHQAVCQRLQTGFAGNLGAGATLGLVGQVEIFQPGLGVGSLDRLFQFRGELFLFGDAFQDGLTALFHLAQITQPFFQVTQLGVVQTASYLFTVTGDKGDGGAFVEQGDGGVDLAFLATDFFGNNLFDTTHDMS